MTTLRLMRGAFAVLGRVAPGLAARWAFHLFFTPPRRKRSGRIDAFLATGRRFEVIAGGDRVTGWSWGEGPAVYLVHGWAGVGGQLAAFAAPLRERGFRVVTFDAPGHGRSTGTRSSILHFAGALRALSAVEGAPHALIGHSLGTAAVVRAFGEGLRAERAVFVGPTSGPNDWSARFRHQLGVPADVMARMRARSEQWLGASWDDFDIPALARSQTIPLLVFHDRDDDEVPWSDGQAIAAAWPGAHFVTTTGLGHRRILRDPQVVRQAVDFVTGGSADRHHPALSGSAAGGPSTSTGRSPVHASNVRPSE